MFSVPPDNFWTFLGLFFRHFSDILSTFPFPKGPKIENIQSGLKFSISVEKSISIENFNLDLQNYPQRIGVWLAARLRFSISPENFNPEGQSWMFSIFGPIGFLWLSNDLPVTIQGYLFRTAQVTPAPPTYTAKEWTKLWTNYGFKTRQTREFWVKNLPSGVSVLGNVIILTGYCCWDSAVATASRCVVFPEESMPSMTMNGATFGFVVRGNLRLDGLISISNPWCSFHPSSCSDHPVNIDMTVPTSDLIFNCSVRSQRLFSHIFVHNLALYVGVGVPKWFTIFNLLPCKAKVTLQG